MNTSDCLELLHSRQSHNKLVAPAPTKEQLSNMFKAALRAPDHALLKPWRFRVFEGKSLDRLGELFVKASLEENSELSEAKLEKIKNKPHRAPMVIIASAVLKEHPKVPHVEQILSTGASVQNLLMAAHFQGIGAMWRTGGLAFNHCLMDLLGLDQDEVIVGFVYLGKEEGDKRKLKPTPHEEHIFYITE
ncbi:nitroreductase [Aliikangiella sp. G2MR2-5]|uniref:nitroreductase family protein n=1 Tax=Aliikangiella sp. G2MR2-5 TaxID=2788943 RepID=UPI0018AC58A4|nr:nitroreductase [Aliikangiella sp. G2MR2-5]